MRGLGAQQKKTMVKNLIKNECLDFIGLVETKHVDLSQWDIMAIWGQQSHGWVHSPVIEGSGGVIVAWHTASFETISSIIAPRWICVIGEFMQDHFRCAVCTIYAPNCQNERLQLWDQLRSLKEMLEFPLMLMGDFNEVLAPAERRGAEITTLSMRHLKDFVFDMQLIDLEINQQFTWLRRNAASRIDRVLVTKEFIDVFPNLRVHCKPRVLSDHYSLIISSTAVVRGPIPFRSLDCWLEDTNFLSVFKREWLQLAPFSFEQKLRSMKGPLRKWNREVFGHIDLKIKAIKEELDKVDQKA